MKDCRTGGGIPRAVEALVLLQRDLGHRPGEVDRREDVEAGLGVALDELNRCV